MKVDINMLNYGLNATTNAIFIDKYDCGGFKNETLIAKTKIVGFSQRASAIIVKAALNGRLAAGLGNAAEDIVAGEADIGGQRVRAVLGERRQGRH